MKSPETMQSLETMCVSGMTSVSEATTVLRVTKKEKCGIFAFFNPSKKNPLSVCIDGLKKLQHRGQECAGVTYNLNGKLNTFKGFGFVDEVFKETGDSQIQSNWVLGHVRYSTSGGKHSEDHIQPLGNETMMVAHNGNIPKLPEPYQHDTKFIFDKLVENLISTQNSNNGNDGTDSYNSNNLVPSIKKFVEQVSGAYCLGIITTTGLYAARDRYGIRPLCIGKDIINGTWYLTSESVALPSTAKKIRDVEPGEIIQFCLDSSTDSLQCHPIQRRHCLFEYIYFLRKDSTTDGVHVEDFRKKCGKKLAQLETMQFDPSNTVVVGAPTTGIPSAIEYANILGLHYEQVLQKTKKRRTFILPSERDVACDTIYQYSEPDIVHKNVILVDDSIVRGTTLKSIAKQFKRIGANEIHIRIASPPVVSECYFGIDIPTKEELIGAKHNGVVGEIAKDMPVDSLVYLTLEDTLDCLGSSTNYCGGCFTGKYPTGLLDW